MLELKINHEYITLSQVLKLFSLVQSGGEAKHAIKQGLVIVNGNICLMRGKKIRKGDTIEFNDNMCKIV